MSKVEIEKNNPDDEIDDIDEGDEDDENTTGTDLNEDDIEDVIDDEIDDDDDDIDEDNEENELEKGNNTGLSNQTNNISNNINTITDDTLLDESDDEDYEYDEDILKKLDFNKVDMKRIHPESIHINNEELKTLTKVVRNKYGIIIDNLHKTIPWISKYEYTKILGQRVKQLNSGAKPLIKSSGQINNYNLAEQEIQEKKLPVIIKRPLPSGGCEYWKLQDLEINISI